MIDLKSYYDLSYKNFIKSVGQIPANSSLIEFVDNDVVRYLNNKKNLSILEAGVGGKSVFEECSSLSGLTMAVDYSKEAIDYALRFQKNEKIEYVHNNILEVSANQSFDLVLDAHLFHCMTSLDQRKKYLERISKWIGENGYFAMECMINHSTMDFDDHFLFLENEGTLLQQVGDSALKVRYIPTALELEDLLKSFGFKIEFFKISTNLKIIPDGSRSYSKNEDPDLGRVICKNA